MEIIKMKASDLYEKKQQQIYTCNFTSSELKRLGLQL